jgi:hypothetical protein
LRAIGANSNVIFSILNGARIENIFYPQNIFWKQQMVKKNVEKRPMARDK